MKKRIIASILVFVCCISLLAGCGKKADPTSVAVKIGDIEITREELLFYYAYYEVIGSIFGAGDYKNDLDKFWQAKNEQGVTFREFYYVTAYAELTYMAIMSNLAVKDGLYLTDAEKATAHKDAEDFYNDFSEHERQKSGITLNGFKIALERQVLVGKYETVLQAKMEVDEDAITAKFKLEDYLCKETEFIAISCVDSEGKQLAGDALTAAYTAMDKALAEIKSGTSCDNAVTALKDVAAFGSGKKYLYDKSTAEQAYTDGAKDLANGEFSEIIKGEKYLYAIKMLNTESHDYYDYIVADAIQKALDAETTNYYEKLATGYTRSVIDSIISQEQFGSFCID